MRKRGENVALMRDQELYDAINSRQLVVDDFPRLTPNNWDAHDSPIQPASLDLHVGKIFLPATKVGELGSERRPLTELSLKTGHTAVVLTRETLRLPSDMAAIGFPPSRVSVRGLLMTNPGHVDPGYVGPMRFAVINMGKDSYPLRQGDAIVTLVLFRLSSAAHKDWFGRGNKEGGAPAQEGIDKLCPDFVDVERRAKEVAEKAVQKADLTAKKFGAIFGGLAALLATVLAAVMSLLVSSATGSHDLTKKVAVLEERLNAAKLEETVKDHEKRLTVVEQGSPGQGGATQPVQQGTPRQGKGTKKTP